LFTAIRVIPAEGKVQARGKYKRRKEGEAAEKSETPSNIDSATKWQEDIRDNKKQKTGVGESENLTASDDISAIGDR